MVRRSDDQASLKLRPDKEDAAQRSPAGAGFTKPSRVNHPFFPAPGSPTDFHLYQACRRDPALLKNASNPNQSPVGPLLHDMALLALS
jgi:hypothetical protein